MTRKIADPTHAPLYGTRVLDFTQNLPGPYATMILASLGAEVIKVEPPKGDTARGIGRIFELVNGGKKSVCVDLKKDTDRARLLAFVKTVDVIVEGFRPGVMASLGFGPDDIRKQSPRMVYCSISAYGQEGPYRDRPGHDLNLQALTGVCDMTRDEDGQPHGAALPVADLSSSMTAVTAILAALYARERTGEGRYIDVALTDTALSFAYVWGEGLAPAELRLSPMLPVLEKALVGRGKRESSGLKGVIARALSSEGTKAFADTLGERLRASDLAKAFERKRLHALPHYDVFRTRDGEHIAIGIVDEDKFWRVLVSALGLPQLGAIPLPGRFALGVPLKKLVAAAVATRTKKHWLETLDLDAVPVSPVLSVYDAIHDPQLASRRPEGATAAVPPPLAFDVSTRPPSLGEHTRALLGE